MVRCSCPARFSFIALCVGEGNLASSFEVLRQFFKNELGKLFSLVVHRKLSMVHRLCVELSSNTLWTLSFTGLLLRHSFIQLHQNVVTSLLLQAPDNFVSDKPLTICYYFTEIIISIWKEQNAVNMIRHDEIGSRFN